ncbi:hypothetical protein Gasu2_21580 [Galdieria sulphuraria]|uniref:Ankyrin repeat containing protein n=1 Tax=Galdieria sulphuraria TaxID=130081 RepID=M2WVB6_GALSU|nr:ankyrin repeat containing protein [Galdieria sulphuraria]EME27910.1 ankyrin repeat containing protein [Galdieria sulphuraria]GJD07821.1 hypothetical protein Gasu2_21580 [Galdieria sulphuraria]|eukprot:XP_005704430.1 ankyrin repeat containing protein [Galdieria sulphuraria]
MGKQLKMSLEPLNLELLSPVVNIGPSSLETMTTALLQDNNCLLQERQHLEELDTGTRSFSPSRRKLLHACAKGNVDTVRNLVQEQKVSPNFYNYDKRTPLHLAAAEGHLEIAQILVEAGASLTTCDRWGCTPIFDAVNGKHQRLTQYLFDALQDNIAPTRRHSTSCSTPFGIDSQYGCLNSLSSGRWSPCSLERLKRYMQNEENTSEEAQESEGKNRDDRGNSDQLYHNSISHLQQINEEYTRKQKELLQIFQQQKQSLVRRRMSRICIDLED